MSDVHVPWWGLGLFSRMQNSLAVDWVSSGPSTVREADLQFCQNWTRSSAEGNEAPLGSLASRGSESDFSVLGCARRNSPTSWMKSKNLMLGPPSAWLKYIEL